MGSGAPSEGLPVPWAAQQRGSQQLRGAGHCWRQGGAGGRRGCPEAPSWAGRSAPSTDSAPSTQRPDQGPTTRTGTKAQPRLLREAAARSFAQRGEACAPHCAPHLFFLRGFLMSFRRCGVRPRFFSMSAAGAQGRLQRLRPPLLQLPRPSYRSHSLSSRSQQGLCSGGGAAPCGSSNNYLLPSARQASWVKPLRSHPCGCWASAQPASQPASPHLRPYNFWPRSPAGPQSVQGKSPTVG